MSQDLKEMDSYKSWLNAKDYIDKSVTSGKMSREEAHKLSKQAQKSYSNDSYNKEIRRLNEKRI